MNTKPYILTLLICLFLHFFVNSSMYAANMAERFVARIYKSKKYSSLPYRLLIPTNYSKTTKYPLVLFLHGAGERGNDNKKHLYVGLDIFADAKKMSQYPCFVVAPQCPSDTKWTDVDWNADAHTMKKEPTETLAMVFELVEVLQKEFSIDASRLYVTGYSMGGFGTWEAIQRKPDMFAAAVPICGGGDDAFVRFIIHIPLWAFHGRLDPTVKVIRSRNMINALVIAGGIPRYTEYPTINHFCWGLAYSNLDMVKWLFDQKK